MRVALCLLTLNEIGGCQKDVPSINREAFDEIYAIDGGSTDGTVEYLIEQNIPIYRQPLPGLNAAHVHAVNKCKCDAIVFFHPKGTVPVLDTLKFKNHFESGYDVVIASRTIKGGVNDEDQKILKPRKWLVFCLALFAYVCWRRQGPMVKDVLHGFRGIKVEAFKKIDPLNVGLSIDIEMVIRSYKKKLKVIEFPTQETPRVSGSTHFKILPTGQKLLRYLVKEIFRKD